MYIFEKKLRYTFRILFHTKFETITEINKKCLTAHSETKETAHTYGGLVKSRRFARHRDKRENSASSFRNNATRQLPIAYFEKRSKTTRAMLRGAADPGP